MKKTYRIYTESPECTATMSNKLLDVAAFFFFDYDNNRQVVVKHLRGRKLTFSHLSGYTFIMHKADSGEYHCTERETGALCGSVSSASNYAEALERMIYAFQCGDALNSAEKFEEALAAYQGRILADVAHITDAPDVFLAAERIRYAREAQEHKHCMSANR